MDIILHGNFSINPGNNSWIRAFAGMTILEKYPSPVIPAKAGIQKTITICGSHDLFENLQIMIRPILGRCNGMREKY